MMKRFLSLTLAFLLCLSLVACGAEDPSSAPAQETAVTPESSETNTPKEEPETEAPATEEAPASETESDVEPETPAAGEELTVSFNLGDTAECAGLCTLSDLYAEVLDDDAMAEGWYYTYTDTDMSPAPICRWEPAEDNYTAEVLFMVKNVSGTPQTFGDRLTGRLLWQETADVETLCFEGTAFQQNPEQMDENGEIMMMSTKPVPIADGESVQVSLRFDIPLDVYEQLFAVCSGEDNGASGTIEFSFGEGPTFVVELSHSMILASQLF